MAITWQNVINVDATLSALPVASQAQILSMVDRMIDVEQWGELADDGRTYLAAHMAALYVAGGGAGEVTAESVGPFSRSYGSVEGVTGPFSTTKHGVFFLQLVAMLPASIGFVP